SHKENAMSRIAKAAVVALGTSVVVVGGAGMALADAGAFGGAAGSPGVLSGNTVQVPVHVPVNVCGNTVNVIALLNPAFGNACVNGHVPDSAGGDDRGGDEGGYGNGGYGN